MQVRFVQHDDGLRAAFPREREVAFDATKIVILVEGSDEEGGVDVRSDNLFRAGGANSWQGRTDPSLPYKDDFGVATDVVLDSKLRKFEIDLSGATYDDVVSPFGWSIESQGRVEPIDLFIDDLRWQ